MPFLNLRFESRWHLCTEEILYGINQPFAGTAANL
jgi:hypothetical protein